MKGVVAAGQGSAFDSNTPSHLGIRFLDPQDRNERSQTTLDTIRRRTARRCGHGIRHVVLHGARRGIRISRIAPVLTIGTLLVLAFGAHGRAGIWRSERAIAESSLLAHPHSLRAHVAVMTSSLRMGNRARAEQAIANLDQTDMIINILPGSPETKHIISAQVLAAFDAQARLLEVAPKVAYVCKDADDQKFIDLAAAHQAILLSKDKAVICMRKRRLTLDAHVATALVLDESLAAAAA